MHATVKQILQQKGQDIWFIKPKATVFEALQLMADKGIGALLVLEDEKLVGIFSERDYARKFFLKGKSSKNTPVSDIMTEKVFVVHPSTTTKECMFLMTEKRARHR
jgi:CBS domain-containing protein